MLMRSDPFRELDALAQQIIGTAARPTAMPMDAYRSGEAFLVLFDLPGVATESIELTVEQNVLTVHASRERPAAEKVEMLAAERPHGSFSRQLFLGETTRHRAHRRELQRRRADAPHPGHRAGQATQGRGQQRQARAGVDQRLAWHRAGTGLRRQPLRGLATCTGRCIPLARSRSCWMSSGVLASAGRPASRAGRAGRKADSAATAAARSAASSTSWTWPERDSPCLRSGACWNFRPS